MLPKLAVFHNTSVTVIQKVFPFKKSSRSWQIRSMVGLDVIEESSRSEKIYDFK